MTPEQARVVVAARAVDLAIRQEGPVPSYHRRVLRRHRAEWPVLWQRLDALSAAVAALKLSFPPTNPTDPGGH